MLCDKLGLDEETVPRMTVKQAEFNKILGATILAEDGSRKPLVTVTQDDLDAWGMEGEPVEGGLIGLDEFVKGGGYQLERHDGDHFMNIFHKAFIDDPVANPVGTASGKYEIYCQSLKDYYDFACFNDIDALPKYKPMPEGYEQAAQEADYRFQLLTIHVIGHSHSSFANVKQLDDDLRQRPAHEHRRRRGRRTQEGRLGAGHQHRGVPGGPPPEHGAPPHARRGAARPGQLAPPQPGDRHRRGR